MVLPRSLFANLMSEERLLGQGSGAIVQGKEEGFTFSMPEVLSCPAGVGTEFPRGDNVPYSFLYLIWPLSWEITAPIQSHTLKGTLLSPSMRPNWKCLLFGLKPTETKPKYSLCHSPATTSQIPKKQNPHLACRAVETGFRFFSFLNARERCTRSGICVGMYACIRVGMHTYVHSWRPKVKVGCLFSSSSPSFMLHRVSRGSWSSSTV